MEEQNPIDALDKFLKTGEGLVTDKNSDLLKPTMNLKEWGKSLRKDVYSGVDKPNSYDNRFNPIYDHSQEAYRANNRQTEFEHWITWGGILLLGIIVFIFVKNTFIAPLTRQNNYRFPDTIIRKSDNIEFHLVNENSNSGTYEYKTEDSSGSITINKSDIKFQTRFYSNLETV